MGKSKKHNDHQNMKQHKEQCNEQRNAQRDIAHARRPLTQNSCIISLKKRSAGLRGTL